MVYMVYLNLRDSDGLHGLSKIYEILMVYMVYLNLRDSDGVHGLSKSMRF